MKVITTKEHTGEGNITPEYLKKVDAYWRAANYLSAAQLYLLDNPLLKEPLKPEHLKGKVVGHWGTIPGQNFIYAHLNRVIKKYDLDMIYVSGPGHGGQVMVSNAYLDGTYSEVYPNVARDIPGLKKLCKQFSFPGGISSHMAPETPGSIHEGGELGYSLAHSFGAVFDNPSLITACVVGDGESETGPLATSWQANKFLNPITDGAVLPILHLNGYKISNPTILSRIPNEELKKFFEGNGWKPYFVEGEDPKAMHELMANTLDIVTEEILRIQENARKNNEPTRPKWPMIVLRTPKGWTGPKMVDGVPNEGSFRAHQVPLSVDRYHTEHLEDLVKWLKSYKPEELFDENGRLVPELQELTPKGNKRMAANPHTNGGLLLKELRTPDFRDYAVDVPTPGATTSQDMIELAKYLRDVVKLNEENRNFRIFGPDETMSNRLWALFEGTKRQWLPEINEPNDEFLAHDGRIVDSMLSEHLCEGWLEGYLLTGRHGFFSSYEAFLRIVDSMITQHGKWLKVTSELPWRKDIASLNLIATSNVWQQDHNGYTHQDPGLLGHIVDKKPEIVRAYLPADANTLLAVFDHCLHTKHKINVLVTSKHPRQQWLTMEEAVKHVEHGASIWNFASNDQGQEPDVVIGTCGDTPTLEGLAAVTILREHLPELKIRFVNVVDMMKLMPENEHPHGLSEKDYNTLFTTDKPIIFAFHGYAHLVNQLTYHRANHNLHVHGYQEEGTITTPFDMRVQNKLDRFNLVKDVVQNLPQLGNRGAHLVQLMNDKIVEHNKYIRDFGEDLPEVAKWQWHV